MRCTQCEIVYINGLRCHETGCPNTELGQCASCKEVLTKHSGSFHANDWDGIEYCKDCAERQAEFEASEGAL